VRTHALRVQFHLLLTKTEYDTLYLQAGYSGTDILWNLREPQVPAKHPGLVRAPTAPWNEVQFL
jgi:hypothetical protein